MYRAKRGVLKGKLSIRVAAARYHVPKTTLHRHLRTNVGSKKVGRPKALSIEEENIVIETVLKYADRGAPLTRAHV